MLNSATTVLYYKPYIIVKLFKILFPVEHFEPHIAQTTDSIYYYYK